MRRVAVFVGAFFLTTAAVGAITEIKITSPASPPYVVGQILTFEIVSNGNVQSETLEYKCAEPNALGTWFTSSSMNILWPHVGNREVRGTTTEMNMGAEGPIETFSLTKAFTIIGPDTDKIEPPLPKSSEPDGDWMVLEVYFYCYASGIRMGGADIDGYAETRIRRPQGSYDSGWGSDADFSWDTEKMVQRFEMPWDPSWDEMANGTVLDDYFQQNRFVVENCCGVKQYYYFTERHFQLRKADIGSFELVEAN